MFAFLLPLASKIISDADLNPRGIALNICKIPIGVESITLYESGTTVLLPSKFILSYVPAGSMYVIAVTKRIIQKTIVIACGTLSKKDFSLIFFFVIF